MKVAACRLRPGDVLIGVLSGKPWRDVRSVESTRNWGFPDGRGTNIDATPIGDINGEYMPIEIASSATIEIADRAS